MNLFNIARTFEMKAKNRWPEIYFCIDLHGTIIPSGKNSDDRKDNLKLYPYAQEVLQWMNSRKDIITILWTSTPESRIGGVLEWFKENGIEFTYVNINPHAKDTPRSSFNKKFYFSILLDDRSSFTPEHDWILVAKQLELSTGNKIIDWNETNKKNLQKAVLFTVSEINKLIVFS